MNALQPVANGVPSFFSKYKYYASLWLFPQISLKFFTAMTKNQFLKIAYLLICVIILGKYLEKILQRLFSIILFSPNQIWLKILTQTLISFINFSTFLVCSFKVLTKPEHEYRIHSPKFQSQVNSIESTTLEEAQTRIKELEERLAKLESRIPKKYPDVQFRNYKTKKKILVCLFLIPGWIYVYWVE